MEVTKMAKGDNFRPFYAKQISQAYFNPNSNELVIGVNSRHTEVKNKISSVLI